MHTFSQVGRCHTASLLAYNTRSEKKSNNYLGVAKTYTLVAAWATLEQAASLALGYSVELGCLKEHYYSDLGISHGLAA
jgi:hypothetical protein